MKNLRFQQAFKFAFTESVEHFLYFLKLILFFVLTIFALDQAVYFSTYKSISIKEQELPVSKEFKNRVKEWKSTNDQSMSKDFKTRYFYGMRNLLKYIYLYVHLYLYNIKMKTSVPIYIPIVLFLVVFIMLLILGELFMYNVISAGINVSNNKPIEKAYFSKLTKTNFWKFIAARFWYYIKVILGFILFIIPGIYIALKYYFTGFDIIDTNASIEEDISTAKKSTKNVKLKLLLYTLLTALILNISGFLILFLWVIFKLSDTDIYKQLSQYTNNNQKVNNQA